MKRKLSRTSIIFAGYFVTFLPNVIARKPVCPVPLVEIAAPEAKHITGDRGVETEGLKLVEAGLDYLSNLRSPLRIVPAIGVYRGGKSFLLNRLMGMKSPYSGGFGVGHGQRTVTRGIEVCAEEVEGIGSIVWMDTEGLFSSEEARSAYGPKIFSLTLLFSSVVLMNNVKVFNDQFFSFFSEQQHLARILKQGLTEQGLPSEMLLPSDLSVMWILQQPIQYDSTSTLNIAQLEEFLDVPGDERRTRVRRDFKHMLHEIPTASNDIRTWGRLDQLQESELIPDYLNATTHLRDRLLYELRASRPLQANAVASQIRLYIDAVQTERFSSALAIEAFEESEIGKICEAFSTILRERAGPLPSTSIHDSVSLSLQEVASSRDEAIQTYHLGAGWSKRLDACLQRQAIEFRKLNSETISDLWRGAASAVAQESRCFFMVDVVNLLGQYREIYGDAFEMGHQADVLDYAAALQRARLVECARVKDLLWPFVPWLGWPIGSMYLNNGLFKGVTSMIFHSVIVFGVYVLLQTAMIIPPYLNVDYPIFRAHPRLLDLFMLVPPRFPWVLVASALKLFGFAFSAGKLIYHIAFLARPAGQKHAASQMVNLELKLNILLKRSEAVFRHEILGAALEAAVHIECGRPRSAVRSLVRGLRLVDSIGENDVQLAGEISSKVRQRARDGLKSVSLPAVDGDKPQGVQRKYLDSLGWERRALLADTETLVSEMIELLGKIVASL